MVGNVPALRVLVPLEDGKSVTQRKLEVCFCSKGLWRAAYFCARARRNCPAAMRRPPSAWRRVVRGVGRLRLRLRPGHQHQQVALSRLRYFADLGHRRPGQLFSRRLMSSKNLMTAACFSPSSSLVLVALLARKLADLGSAMATNGSSGSTPSVSRPRRRRPTSRPSSPAGAGRACRCRRAGSPRRRSCAGTALDELAAGGLERRVRKPSTMAKTMSSVREGSSPGRSG